MAHEQQLAGAPTGPTPRQAEPDRGKRLVVIGAGGHGRVVADAAASADFVEIAFIDDMLAAGGQMIGYPVLGSLEKQASRFESDPGLQFIVAIGGNQRRLELHRSCVARGFEPATVIHPRATISPHARIGRGSVVLAGCVINAGAVVGQAVIVNTGARIDHDCVLHDGVHLSPGVNLGGAVEIGERSWLGVGASVRNGMRIGSDVMVGVGAAVVSPLDQPGTYVGVPARPLNPSVP